MEAFKKTVLVPIILIVLVFAIEYVRSSAPQTSLSPAILGTSAQPASQAPTPRMDLLPPPKAVATSTILLMQKYGREALQKYASSTYNPSSVKQNNI